MLMLFPLSSIIGLLDSDFSTFVRARSAPYNPHKERWFLRSSEGDVGTLLAENARGIDVRIPLLAKAARRGPPLVIVPKGRLYAWILFCQ